MKTLNSFWSIWVELGQLKYLRVGFELKIFDTILIQVRLELKVFDTKPKLKRHEYDRMT